MNLTRTVLVFAALALAGCLGAITESAAPLDQRAPGGWTTLTPLPSPRQEVAVAALEGKVYVIGGFSESARPLRRVDVYDPVTNTWAPLAPYPVAVHHAAAAVVGSRLFVLGGFSGGRVRWTALDDVYEYVPARDRWDKRAPLPTPRGALAAASLAGAIHALGGRADHVTGAHEVYDLATDRWRAANAMPTARDHLAAVAFDGRLWAIGGRASFIGAQYGAVEIYDPATDSWRTGPSLPTGRGGIGAVALPDGILVLGGEAPFRIFKAVDFYERTGNRWIAKEPMPTPRHGIGAAVIDGRVYVPGGGTEPGLAASAVNEAWAP